MVSRTGYVQARNDVAVLFVIIAIGGLMVVQVRSSAENITSSVRDARQVENEWASTSKKDHKGPNTYAFSYDVENSPTNNVQYRMEERHPNGSVVGSYGQVQPGGQIRVISYIADMDGVKTYVKDNGGDQYVAEGSSLDPIQRVTSQIIETASKSQQQQHRSPLYDKYHRPTPSTAADRVVTAHAYHQQRTKIDPATFRPHDSPGFRETEQPFIGDQLKDKLHATQADYHVQQTARPLQPLPSIIPYNLPVPTSTPTSPQLPSTHYVLNVPPLPALADNSPLPLLPGQQPLPITPNRGPITIQLQHQQQSQHYQPLHEHQQQLLRLPPPPQQQLFSPVQAQQQYQQQPVRIQSPAHLHQNVQYHPQQARAVAHQVQPAQQHQRQLQQLQQQHQQQLQQQQQKLQQQQQQQLQQQQHLQQQQQQQQKSPYQQSVMQQPYTQHVNIPAHPSQLHLRGTVQQHHTTAPMQFFHQPNPATTMEQYRQQLQLQAAESRLFPAFALPPDDSVFDFDGNR